MQKIRLKSNFRNWLKDPGLQLKHPLKKDVHLEDFFVFPELRGKSETINSEELLRIGESENIKIISGVEDSGKTTLMDKEEIHNIVASFETNTFAIELFHEIIESIIKNKSIDSNQEKILVDILGAQGGYGSLSH